MELVYTGSVKDLYKDGNKLVFKYSNRYSIFDWGEMPDEIPHKGEALASMAASFFEHLAKKGIPFLRARDNKYIVSLEREFPRKRFNSVGVLMAIERWKRKSFHH